MSSPPAPSIPIRPGINITDQRYRFVDGLRAIAALGVVFHHLLHNTVLEPALRTILPEAVQEFCKHGAVGVQIFFVISGFVIAHSLRATEISAGTAASFILRRQLRLDPPYWVMLAFVLMLALLERLAPGLASAPLPNLQEVFLNAVYLQEITGASPILGVAWTLCLEVQFYLVLIGVLALGRWLDRRPGDGLSPVTVLLVFVTGALSLVLAPHQKVFGPWMLPYWSYFAAGVMCKLALGGQVRRLVFFSYVGLFALATIWQRTPAMYAGLATFLALYAVGRSGHLSDWLDSAPFQYFGRISYSLYLIHLPVLCVIMRAGYKLTGTNPWAALAWFGWAGCGSVLAAHLLYLAVEKPSMRFAARFKKRHADSGAAVPWIASSRSVAPCAAIP